MIGNEFGTRQAQYIADGIMKLIPYDIEIVDRRGYVIASRDKSRLHTLHTAAVQALSTLSPYIVYQSTERERRGINLPFFYNGNVVGVIHIRGDIDKVMPIGQMVVMTVQLMMENRAYEDLAGTRSTSLQGFLSEWADFDGDVYPPVFLEQGMSLGVDITLPYVAVLFVPESTVGERQIAGLEGGRGKEHFVRRQEDALLFAMLLDEELESRAEKMLAQFPALRRAFIGEAGGTLFQSARRARQLRRMAAMLRENAPVLFFSDFVADRLLLSAEPSWELLELQQVFVDKDTNGELGETLRMYLRYSPNLGEVCGRLHIHRNTLGYRLGRLQELTGKNPRCGKDAVLLYAASLRALQEAQPFERTNGRKAKAEAETTE